MLWFAAACWTGIPALLAAEAVVRISSEVYTYQVLEINGQVWLATDQGAFRVDGDSATPFLEVPVAALAEVDGLAWLGTEHGAFIVQGENAVPAADEVANLPSKEESLPITTILDVEEAVWLGTSKGLYLIRNESAKVFLEGQFIKHVARIGNQRWVATNKNAYVFDGAEEFIKQLDLPRRAVEIVEAGGYIWILTEIGNNGHYGPSIRLDGNHQTEIGPQVISVAEINQEAWLATPEGLFRFVSGFLQPVSLDGFNEPINTIALLRNEVWLGTTRGALRQRERVFSPIPAGAPELNINGLGEAGGKIWLWGDSGAYRLDAEVNILVRPSVIPFPWRDLVLGRVLEIDEARYDHDGVGPYPAAITVIMRAKKESFDDEVKNNSFTPATSLQRTVPYGIQTIHLMARDPYGNTTGHLTYPVFVVPGPSILVVLWFILAIAVIVVAPRYDPAMSLIMFPTVVPWLSSLFVAPLALSLVRRHLLSRYRRELLEFGQKSGWTTEDSLSTLVDASDERKLVDALAEHERLRLEGKPNDTRRYLRFLACRLAARTDEPLADFIPVFLRLEIYAESREKLEEGILAQLADLGGITEPGLATAFLKRGGFIFLLDGLGRVGKDGHKAVEQLVTAYRGKNLIVVGAEPETVEIDGFPIRATLQAAPERANLPIMPAETTADSDESPAEDANEPGPP